MTIKKLKYFCLLVISLIFAKFLAENTLTYLLYGGNNLTDVAAWQEEVDAGEGIIIIDREQYLYGYGQFGSSAKLIQEKTISINEMNGKHIKWVGERELSPLILKKHLGVYYIVAAYARGFSPCGGNRKKAFSIYMNDVDNGYEWTLIDTRDFMDEWKSPNLIIDYPELPKGGIDRSVKLIKIKINEQIAHPQSLGGMYAEIALNSNDSCIYKGEK